MKKHLFLKSLLITIGLLVTSINTVWAASVTSDGTKRLYFNAQAQSYWTDASAKLYAYFYNCGTSSGCGTSSWSEEAVCSHGKVYYVLIPSGTWQGVILTRHNPNKKADGSSGTFDSPSWKNKWSQTGDITLDGTKTYIASFEADKTTATWEAEPPMPYLKGSFDEWGDGYRMLDGTVTLTLEESATFEFKIYGQDGAWYGKSYGTISNTTDSWLNLDSKNSSNDNVTFTAGEAGEYIFKWSSDGYVGVYYPQARLKKNTYLYLNVTNETYWNKAGTTPFEAKFYFKYYDSGSDLPDMPLTCSTPLEDYVYYAIVPNNDYVGRVQVERYVNSSQDGRAEPSQAYGRTSSLENCLIEQSEERKDWKDSWIPSWTTYCPIKATSSISDNGTVKTWGGSGTSGSPYYVATGSKIKVSSASTDHISDGNMTTKYDFQVRNASDVQQAHSDGTATTYEYTVPATNDVVYKVRVNSYNYYNSTSSTDKWSTDIYYKARTPYTISYNAGTGGSGSRDSETKLKGVNFTLPSSAVFTRTGYTQTGWTTSDGGAQTHALGGSYTGNVAQEFFPVWTAKNYTVTLDNQSADIAGAASVSATYDANLPSIASSLPYKNGYVFGGYWSEENGGGTKYINEWGSYVNAWDQDVAEPTIYAYWIASGFTFEKTTVASISSALAANTIVGTTTGGIVKYTPDGAGSPKIFNDVAGLLFSDDDGCNVTVYLAKNIQAGTVINAVVSNPSTSTRGLYMQNASGTTKGDWRADGTGTHVWSYVAIADDGLVGTNKFILRRAGVNEHLVSLSIGNLGSDHTYTLTLDDGRDGDKPTATVKMADTSIDGCYVATTSPGRQFAAWGSSGYYIISTDGSIRYNAVDASNTYSDASGRWIYDGNVTLTPCWGATSYICGERVVSGETVEDGEFGGWSNKTHTFDIDGDEGTLDIQLTGDKWYHLGVHEYEGVTDNYRATATQIDTDTRSHALETTSGYITFHTTNTGLYRFVYTFSTNTLEVKFADYQVTYGNGDNGGAITVDPATTSGNYYYVGYSFTVTKGTPSSGYDFVGWFPNTDAMWGRYSGENSYEATISSADINIYACYEAENKIHFIAGDGSDAEKWNSVYNWSRGALPTISQDVTIYTPVNVDVANAKAKSVLLDQNPSFECANPAKLTVNAGKALLIATTIQKKDDSGTGATEETDIVLESDGTYGTGALIAGSESTDTKATVQFYTLARINESDKYVNQYFGPAVVSASKLNYYGSYLRTYSQSLDQWISFPPEEDALTMFNAYRIMRDSKDDGETYNVSGTLYLPGTGEHKKKELILYNNAEHDNDNMFSNSYTAPIDITNMTPDDFVGATATIYIFNAGSKSDAESHGETADKGRTAGQWLAIPIEALAVDPTAYDVILPSQQAFLVQANGLEGTHTLTLDYDKHVYTPALSSVTITPTHAPKRQTEENTKDVEIMHIYVNADESNLGDRLYIYMSDDFKAGEMDNGWEGYKMSAAANVPQLCAFSDLGEMSIMALPSAEGTVLGFYAGTEDDHYTFSFDYNGEDTWYLNDLDEKESTVIDSANEYAFTATKGTVAASRFTVSKTPIHKTPTGIEDVDGGVNARKLMMNGTLYIIRDGRIYNAEGSLVK